MCISPDMSLEQRAAGSKAEIRFDQLELFDFEGNQLKQVDLPESEERKTVGTAADVDLSAGASFLDTSTGCKFELSTLSPPTTFNDQSSGRAFELSALSAPSAAQSQESAEIDDSDEEDLLEWDEKPWDWLTDSEDEDDDTREFLREFTAEVKASFDVSMIQEGVVDFQLLDLVESRLRASRKGSKIAGGDKGAAGAGAADAAASSVVPVPPPQPRSPPGSRPTFVRRRFGGGSQASSSPSTTTTTMAGAIARSLRRAISKTSSANSKKRERADDQEQ